MNAEAKFVCEVAQIIYEKPLSGVYDEVVFDLLC